ncbi:PAS domain-containing protein [Variovorax saccharolyticus]|uniref:PAS domain-containing protein n=1 Tax=Variovorax saccharolyticus TaxID=3053516 RepID=UPI0025766B94|nr:PAS domain-containing protein [Variovorax sp. J31P216]MDM0029114.1 PAS domain-containing protein [Variovorax sp. J31P216]
MATVIVPSALIVVVSIYVLAYRPATLPDYKVLPGMALATYDEFYPIQADDNGALFLDRERFDKAVNFLTDNPSPRAIADLIYLGNSNNVALMLDGPAKTRYSHLTKIPDYVALAQIDQERDHIFQPYRDIVNGVGQTFAGTPIEIVLHDTRNPLRSIIAVQNPISGRRLGDTNTNFGIQLIKNYSLGQGRGESFVSYPLSLKDGRAIKSTTIPIFHDIYGLIGFICINVDISKMEANSLDLGGFVDNFKATHPNDSIREMIQSSKRKN